MFPFVDINTKTFGEDFIPTNLLTQDKEKRMLCCNRMKANMRLMMINNRKQLVSNLDNVVKHLPKDREFTVFGKKYNDYSYSRFVLQYILFLDCGRKSVDLFTPAIRSIIFSYLPY